MFLDGILLHSSYLAFDFLKNRIMITLSNNILSVSVKESGAELSSLRMGGREYLWQAHEAFWKRHSPVLFPIVGSVWNGEYRIEDHAYHLGQHGFARDMEFTLVSQTDTEVLFALESSDETLAKYPYPFRLEIGYRLRDNRVDVIWRVINPAEEEMFFQIGAHPAFYWPGEKGADDKPVENDGTLAYFRLMKGGFAAESPLLKSVITEKGCVGGKGATKVDEEGLLPLTFETFRDDALIFEGAQIDRVELLTADRKPYLDVDFSAPLVGLWTPPSKHAPFVCIEPWYGRCDRVGYTGDFRTKDHVQSLAPGHRFEAVYTITLH